MTDREKKWYLRYLAVKDWILDGIYGTYQVSANISLQEDIRTIIGRYSSVSPEFSHIRDVTNGHFRQLEIPIYAEKKDENIRYAVVSLKNAMLAALQRDNVRYGKVYVYHDYRGYDNLHLLTGYYSATHLQMIYLDRWQEHMQWQRRQGEIAELQQLKDRRIELDIAYPDRISRRPSPDGKIKICAGCWIHQDEPLKTRLMVDVGVNPHWLICGRSGSGKSKMLAYLLYSLLDYRDLTIFFCDPKGSGDFSGILPNYAEYDACTDLIEQAYKYYVKIKTHQTGERMILIIDEYPAYVLRLEGMDKKKAQEIKNMISEILMQGRALPGGGSAAIWILAQRADADYFPKGARLNFKVVVALGQLDTQSRTMLFPGEDLPDYPIQQGLGVIWVDGQPIRVIKVPYLPSEIKKVLDKKGKAQ